MQKNKGQYYYDDHFVADLTSKVIDNIIDNPENMCKLLDRIKKYIKSIDTLTQENEKLKKDYSRLESQLKRVRENYKNEKKKHEETEYELANLKDDFESQLKEKDARIEDLNEHLQEVAIEKIKNNTQENEILENEGRSNTDVFLEDVKAIKNEVKKIAHPAIKILKGKKYSSIDNFKALLYLYSYKYLALILENVIDNENGRISFEQFLSSAPIILKDHIEILEPIKIEQFIRSIAEESGNTDISISVIYNNEQLLQSIKDGNLDFIDHQDKLIASAEVNGKDGKPLCNAIKII